MNIFTTKFFALMQLTKFKTNYSIILSEINTYNHHGDEQQNVLQKADYKNEDSCKLCTNFRKRLRRYRLSNQIQYEGKVRSISM